MPTPIPAAVSELLLPSICISILRSSLRSLNADTFCVFMRKGRPCQSMADGMPSSVHAYKEARQMMGEDFQHSVFLKKPKPEPVDDEHVEVKRIDNYHSGDCYRHMVMAVGTLLNLKSWKIMAIRTAISHSR